MRIAIPIHSFEPGGVERVALRLAERWRNDGQDVVIVLGRDRGPSRASAPTLDYRTLREPWPTDRWETIWMIWSMFRFLLAEKVDVIFCPGNTYTIVCVMMKILLGRRCPPVLVKISNDLERADMPLPARLPYNWWLRFQGAYLEHFVALAEPMRPQIRAKLDVAPDRVSCVPDPALSRAELERAPKQRPARKRASSCRFLSVGRLCAQKNQVLMIEAFARHARPGDTLVIAGEGPERKRLEERIASLGLAGRVELPGHVENPAKLYADADVFLLSSDYEGVPAVVLEALAAGLPLVATDCCASMDWLTGSGRFGVLADCRDVDGFGAAMNVAREMEPSIERMHRLAAGFTLENSSWLYLRDFERVAAAYGRNMIDNYASRLRNSTERGV